MQNFYFVKAKTEKEFASKIKSVVNISIGKTNPDGGFKVILSGKDGKTEVCLIWGSDIPTIAHEVSHAVSHVLSRKNIPLSDDTTEIYAYYTQFLIKSILRTRK